MTREESRLVTKICREATTKTMVAGIDTLTNPDGNSERREQLASDMKCLLTRRDELEESACETEYWYGICHGYVVGCLVAIGGYLVGELIYSAIKSAK